MTTHLVNDLLYLTGYATIICILADFISYLFNHINMLKGYKTFIVSGLMVAYVLLGYFLGEGFNTELLLQALAIAGLRDALK